MMRHWMVPVPKESRSKRRLVEMPGSAPLMSLHSAYTRLPERLFARVEPTPVSAPALVRLNRPLALQLGLDSDMLESPAGVEVLSGNRLPENSEPLAMAYAGHQFGNFVPSLGDGRAILLGEVQDHSGILRDLQLKGAGRTPFSRMGDGRAGLPSVMREYLASEAMAGLGIPSQRALALTTTGEPVYREEVEPGALLTRVASSHVRFGTFQYFLYRGDPEALRALADHVVERHYPDLSGHPDGKARWLALLERVTARTADLVADWMLVGFIHGVMNTDNMSIVGETIDFGPFGFMDSYHPETVFSSIDQGGRYAFNQQPGIAGWNLARFAETLLPLMKEGEEGEDELVESAQQALKAFGPRFSSRYQAGLLRKLGLERAREGDPELAGELLSLMAQQGADYTLAFRRLSALRAGDTGEDEPLRELFAEPRALDAWLERWRARLEEESAGDAARRRAMEAVNPAFVLRNHHAQRVIDAAVRDRDFAPFHELVEVLGSPFEDQPGREHWSRPPRPEEVVPYTTCGT